MTCPVCKKQIVWYGDGDPPPGPCPRCFATMSSVPTSTADVFWEFALEAGEATVIRRRSSTPVVRDGEVVGSAWELSWRTPGETTEGWRRITYTEHVLLDDYGNVSKADSIWQRVQNTGDVRLQRDTSWTGAF